MINRKSRDEIKRMRHAGHIVALVHQKMREVIEPGISTKELDSIAHDIIRKERAIPTFLGYNGFPGSICASINEQVVHGIPSSKMVLKEGDIVSVDCGVYKNGFHGDSAYTFCVGDVKPEILLLDEPASALDPVSTSKLEDTLKQLRSKYTMIMVTHNMQQASRISDYTAFFHLGHAIEYNSTAEIFTNPKGKITENYIQGSFG